MPVLLVVGTRPEIIKLGPVSRELTKRGTESTLVHTGQHFDPEMSDSFLATFGLDVDMQLQLGGLSRGAQIGQMTDSLTTILERERPHVVIVQGDTNTALAGALAANAVGCALVHVEAGLRSFDRRMPEENNRVLVDLLADHCAAPTETAARNLRDAGVTDDRIEVTGNTVMDAIELIAEGHDASSLPAEFGLLPHEFVLATLHRPENTDDPVRLDNILACLASTSLPVLLPLHPRTREAIDHHGLADICETGNIRLIEPLDYSRFLGLLGLSAFAVSDSGGIQEEVTAMGVPVIVVRDSTERPEVLGTFAELVSGADAEKLRSTIERLARNHASRRAELAALPSPYASPDGRSPSAHVVDLLPARPPD